jgi:hypothetical protein
MSSTIDTTPLALSNDSKQPLTVREKIVNLFQELEGTRDEQQRVNSELEKEIETRIEVE